MDPFATRAIGRTGLHVTQLGCGGATLGDIREVIPESQADVTLEGAYAAGIGYFDTAPWYGNGRSEHRLGRILGAKPRESYVLSTKIGRVFFRPPDPQAYLASRPAGAAPGALPFDLRFDYTREGVFRSYEDSLQRLGINTVDALLIHDLDLGYHKTEEGVAARLDELDQGGGYAALEELKRRGEIRAIGAGINVLGMIPRFLERFPLDFFLVAMPYTLLEQGALDHELPLCAERGVGVVIGAPFGSGILARGPDAPSTYGYRPAEAPVVERTRRIAAVCARHDVPLGAAALQFPLGHPSVASVIPGPNSPQQVRSNVQWMRTLIPAPLWSELKGEGLLRPDAPVPV
jgi:D-threo-aldose 1-dehydrogenase